MVSSLKSTGKSKKSKKFNSTNKKKRTKGSNKFTPTVSSFDPSEKEIIKKKMIDRLLRSREPPRKSRRITRLAMTQQHPSENRGSKYGKPNRSRTPGGKKSKRQKSEHAEDMLNKIQSMVN
jgi:hypothetical protein